MTASARAHERERERVGPYVLVKAIGAGGSARVDLARIERAYGFQRHVVIKRPLEHLRGDARAAEGLRREARLGGRLRHPNLVAILDAGMHDGYDYLVLEYVHGGALRSLMQGDDPSRVRDMPLEVALAIVRDVARGLHDAHELTDESGAPLGLVHRDVSPGNVLVGLDGAVKLADFGIAKETRVATLSGSMHGTVTYMAPEQCRGHAFDRRADIFSLGVILYELATGHRLFWADNDVASLHRVLEGSVPRPRKVRASIPVVLEDIIMNAVAPDPQKRFPTARSLADALETFGAGAGAILGARHVARWVHDVLGPRDVPWVGAATVVDVVPIAEPSVEQASAGTDAVAAHAGVTAMAAVDGGVHAAVEHSLIALIAATPPDEEAPATFGPTDGAQFDELDTEPDRLGAPTRPAAVTEGRHRRALMGLVIGAGLLGGGIVNAVVMTRDEVPRAPAAAAQPRDSAPQLTDTPIAAPLAASPTTDAANEPASTTTQAASPNRAPTQSASPDHVTTQTASTGYAMTQAASKDRATTRAAPTDRATTQATAADRATTQAVTADDPEAPRDAEPTTNCGPEESNRAANEDPARGFDAHGTTASPAKKRPRHRRSSSGASDRSRAASESVNQEGANGTPSKPSTPTPPTTATRKATNVEWDPTMLLPTDSGSGTKR